jgi:hypothetical protein
MIVLDENSLLMIIGSCRHKWTYKDSSRLQCRSRTSPFWLIFRLEDMELSQTEVFNGGDDGSPRLGLLNNLPMAVPFRTRLEVFRQFVAYVLALPVSK